MTVLPRPNGSAEGHAGGHGDIPVMTAEPAALPRPRVSKAPNAFRTISEVADDLHIPQHVLRFWETKFPQIRPLKRGGNRRYYRPDDITLLRRISDLLYTQGFTIKGVQRLLREGGGRLSDDIPPPTDDDRLESARVESARLESARLESGLAADPEPPLQQLDGRQPPPAGSGSPSRPDRASGASEVDRLRGVLADLLGELEALRARLA